MNLDELGIKYGTDKASIRHCKGEIKTGHNYLNYYENILFQLRNEKFTLIELGCYRLASLRLWREYFSQAQIVGVDLNEKLISIEENIDIITSDATDDNLIKKINQYKNIKCIIDDASHAWGDQRYSLEMLWPVLENGGYYIIEDLECGSYGAYSNAKFIDAQPFFEYMLDRFKILRVSNRRNQIKNRPFFNQLPKHIQELEISIDMVFIIPGAVIIKKKL